MFNWRQQRRAKETAEYEASNVKRLFESIAREGLVTVAIAKADVESHFGFAEKAPAAGQPDPLLRLVRDSILDQHPTFTGVVHEEYGHPPWAKIKNIWAKVTCYDANPKRPHFGETYLSTRKVDRFDSQTDHRATSLMNRQFELQLYLSDYNNSVGLELWEALRDAAASAGQFVHATFQIDKPETGDILTRLTSALADDPGSDSIKLGRVTRVIVNRGLVLDRAPAWAWRWNRP